MRGECYMCKNELTFMKKILSQGKQVSQPPPPNHGGCEIYFYMSQFGSGMFPNPQSPLGVYPYTP